MRGVTKEAAGGLFLSSGHDHKHRPHVGNSVLGWFHQDGHPLAANAWTPHLCVVDLKQDESQGLRQEVNFLCRRVEELEARVVRLEAAPRTAEEHLTPNHGSGGDFAASVRWIEAHRSEYRGKWVALFGDKLVGSDSSRAKLQDHLSSDPRVDNLLFALVEE